MQLNILTPAAVVPDKLSNSSWGAFLLKMMINKGLKRGCPVNALETILTGVLSLHLTNQESRSSDVLTNSLLIAEKLTLHQPLGGVGGTKTVKMTLLKGLV